MPRKTQQLTTVVKGDFTFLFDSVKFQGKSRERARGVSGKLVEKWKNVEKSKIPDPLMGEIKELFPYNVMDKGHIIARELGGPNIPENVVPMYGYFNRRGMWKAKERQLGEAIDEAPFVAIMIDYLAGGRLPNAFRIKTSSSRIDIPFAGSDFGNTVEMRLYAPAAYAADPVIAARIEAVLPAAKPSDKPYEFMDSQRKAWGLRDCLETEKFNADEREYIRVANSLFSRKSQPANQQGFLFSDDPDDTYNVLNYQGNEDFPEVDHIIPRSFGGGNAFANAQLISWQQNSSKRSKITPMELEKVKSLSDARKLERGIGTRSTKKVKYV